MAKTIYYWMNSGANAHSCRYGEVSLDTLGVTDAEWDAMSDDDKDDLIRDCAFDMSEWGWSEDRPARYQR